VSSYGETQEPKSSPSREHSKLGFGFGSLEENLNVAAVL
jgi:hypothetical protein